VREAREAARSEVLGELGAERVADAFRVAAAGRGLDVRGMSPSCCELERCISRHCTRMGVFCLGRDAARYHEDTTAFGIRPRLCGRSEITSVQLSRKSPIRPADGRGDAKRSGLAKRALRVRTTCTGVLHNRLRHVSLEENIVQLRLPAKTARVASRVELDADEFPEVQNI
jgi:hypothetical protein